MKTASTRLSLIFLFCTLLASSALMFFGVTIASHDVPAEYQELYSFLDTTLTNFNSRLDAQNTSTSHSLIFGAELLPANSNRGTALLDQRTTQGVTLYLDRLQDLGVRGVTIPIGYPLYTPSFPHYLEYVQFYKQVVQEVRKRGMTLAVESSAIFANTEFSTLQVDYSGLTFDKFESERKQMIATLIQDVKPDFLNLGAEPDTQFQLLGLKEFASPAKYTEYVNYVLNGLDRGSTKIGAGIGTWGNLDYVRSLAANTTLDSIHIHVYPIYRDFLQKILTISDIARQYGKHVVLDEAWLSKAEKPSGMGSVASSPEIFRRDVFSFWAPLDQKFLAVIVRSARIAQIDYISPFWTQFFFGYVDYNASNANLPFKELSALTNQIAYKNLVAGKVSPTGEFYRQLAGGPPITITRATSSTTQEIMPQQKVARGRFAIYAAGLVSLAVGIVVVMLLLWRFRKR